MEYHKITEWKEGFYRITSPECVFCDLIVGQEKALLLDTGWGFGDLAGTVRSLTDKPLILVNSHGHVDHICGNQWFEGPVHIHPKDIPLSADHGSTPMRNFTLMAGESMGLISEEFDKERYMAGYTGEYAPVTEGFVFDLGGVCLEVVDLPGHTAGSIGLYCREEKLLYVADAVCRMVLLYLEEAASLSTYIATLEKVQAMDVQFLLPGHQQEPVDQAAVALYLQVARSADWDNAVPYVDDKGQASETVRIMCAEGKTQANIMDPDFACVVFTKEKLA